MSYFRNYWYRFGAILFIILAVILLVFRPDWSMLHYLLYFNFMALLAHQFEEYQFPGGASPIINYVVYDEEELMDRFPGNTQSIMLVNTIAWLLYIASIAFPQAYWLGLGVMFFSLTQLLGHGFQMNIKLKTWYNPGLATTVFLLVPIACAYIYQASAEGMLTWGDWLGGFIMLIVCVLSYEDEGKFQRKMTSRHLFMLSLGGVIGTGLFLSSGYTIAQAGPLGAVLSYLIGAVVVYLVMLSLGELAVAMPVTGSFHTYATKFISPGTGFTVAWLYWICWTVALGTEFLGAAMLMQRWFPDVPAWTFASFFALVIFGLNALSVRFFAEAESFFSSIKVIAIIIFIILGLGAMFGLVSFEGQHKAILFTHLTANGDFPNGIVAVVSVMLAVNYAFSGTELIGIAAGETDNPKEAVPRAIKTTIGRLVVFFVLTIVVLASLLPMKEAGVSTAPFVDVFDKMGVPFAADIMNFVILTAILSAGNSGLYASSRMLWSLANEGMLSKSVVKINKYGVPMRALLLSMAGAVLSLFSSIYAADTVYLALVSIPGFAVVVVWLAIPVAQINFRKEFLKENQLEDLSYKTPFTPVLPYITIILLLISIVGIAWDSSQRAGLYFGVPFIIFCYIYHKLRYKKW